MRFYDEAAVFIPGMMEYLRAYISFEKNCSCDVDFPLTFAIKAKC